MATAVCIVYLLESVDANQLVRVHCMLFSARREHFLDSLQCEFLLLGGDCATALIAVLVAARVADFCLLEVAWYL